MRDTKYLKIREVGGITERKRWPTDLPGFEPGTFRLLGESSSNWATSHGPWWMEFKSDLVNWHFHRCKHLMHLLSHLLDPCVVWMFSHLSRGPTTVYPSHSKMVYRNRYNFIKWEVLHIAVGSEMLATVKGSIDCRSRIRTPFTTDCDL